MNRDRELLLHFLAAIAYRTQKAVRGAPTHYPDLAVGHGARTPVEILRHMTSLMGYTQTFFRGGEYPMVPAALPTFTDEVARFHDVLIGVGDLLKSGESLQDISSEQLLQGPLADTMTHVGQLALLRRLSDSAVRGENFLFADVRPDRLGVEQPSPVRPDPD